MRDSNNRMTPVVFAFGEAREACPHYTGIKEDDSCKQCTHDDNDDMGHWCAMDVCPLLKQAARSESLGWD